MRGEERREAKNPSKPVGQRGPSLAGLGGELGLMPPCFQPGASQVSSPVENLVPAICSSRSRLFGCLRLPGRRLCHRQVPTAPWGQPGPAAAVR